MSRDAPQLFPRGPLGSFPPMWVIYVWPDDLPNAKYVARLWYGESATNEYELFDDLVSARAKIALCGGCALLERSPEDDPGIVEVWL